MDGAYSHKDNLRKKVFQKLKFFVLCQHFIHYQTKRKQKTQVKMAAHHFFQRL